MMKKIIVLLILLSTILAGCATLPPPMPVKRKVGVYHYVKKGESLSQIAKMYHMGTEEIFYANRLSDKDKIYVGQLLFIPGVYPYRKSASSVRTGRIEDKFIWPLKNKVCSYFGSIKNRTKNKGIDIKAREGAIIVAAKSGTVTMAANNVRGYGKVIIIDHSRGYQTVYAYNSENLVKTGQFVVQDSPIARAGSTGRTEIPCLHFEIRENHQPCNPLNYLP